MGDTVTLELPKDIAESARAFAAESHRPLEDVLVEWLSIIANDIPVHLLPDEQVLALRDMQMDATQQEEMSDLLAAQGDGTIDDAGRKRLKELLKIYGNGMIRKSTALQVAIERGLQPPLR
ncbi:MAG TPA: hypothetical protein VMV29_19910 [Ktedonobacterales bacterium]|nr:hypothetical protein [Ktedonobacterales bacterium]